MSQRIIRNGDGAAPSRALVIDDEPDVADAIAEFLRDDGSHCDTPGNGVEAKRLIAVHAYDLIVSDLRMPDMDGAALAAWIETHRPDLAARLAFVTGDSLGPAAERFLSTTGYPYMAKPFTSETLRTLVATLERGR